MAEFISAHSLLPPERWTRSSSRVACAACTASFSPVRLKHHCRKCGEVVCVMCYVKLPVNLPVVGVRRVKICTVCHSVDTRLTSTSSSHSSSSHSQTTSDASNASTRALAMRNIRHMMNSLVPIDANISSSSASHSLDMSSSALSEMSNHDRQCREWDVSKLHSDVVWIDAINLIEVEIIGCGGHGIVWLMQDQKDEKYVASKRLVDADSSAEMRTRFIDEIQLVAVLKHPRIIDFIGVAWTKTMELQALFEYLPGGDLRRYLSVTRAKSDEEAFTRSGLREDKEKLQIAIDVADALAYIHYLQPSLVHRDIKTKNVLLDEQLRAKLTDFGVSRYQSAEASMTTGVGTGRWVAPEVLNGGGDYTAACDVFSFGLVLAELDTSRSPYSDLLRADGQPLPEIRLMLLISVDQAKPSFSAACPPELVAIARQCLSFDPTNRPSAANVALHLRQFQARILP